MPRRKSEKCHAWPPPPQPPPLHATTPVKNNILSSVDSSNRLNDEVDGSGFQNATAASVLVDRFAFAGLSSKPAASQDDGTPKNGQGLRQNRSLEALFQAADSELQNYSARNAEPLPLTKPISEDGDAGGTPRVPDALGIHVQNSLTNVSIAAPSFPVFRLNFHADQQTELLPSSLSSQGVVCIKVINTNPPGQLLQPETSPTLQAVGILPGHGGLQPLQPASKPEKLSLVNRPGKHVCPYCNRFCAKPSVLQKHIRTHTGERPYPCNECGFRFKTKSNLYKHCKSRVHLTKRESDGQVPDCMSAADAYESQIPSEEMEDQDDDLSPEVNMEIAAADDNEPDGRESPKAVPLSSLGLKYFSCDTLKAGSTDADALNFSATSRSLSVPESNEDRVSVGLHSLLRLSDGTIYLMEKMSNGHAMLRPVLQEVALPAAVPIPHSVAASHSRPAEPSSFGAALISTVTTDGKNSEKEHQILALEAGKVQNEVRQMTLLPENVGVRHIQMFQKPSLANAAAASANNKPDFNNSFPMLQLSDDSAVCVMEQAAATLPRPILQEATHRHLMPLASAVSSISSSFSRGNEINVSSKVSSIQLKAGMGPVQSGKEQQCRGPEKPAIHFEGQPVLSIPSRSRHSKYLHKSSSAGVPAMPNPNIMISHRSLSVPGSHNISIAPKMAPMDPKNVTPEAVQERIAMLISQNASIIDTPMADAPRPKRVLRHNSEVVAASAQKPDSSSLSAAKSLQRAKSLTPFASVSSTVLKNNPSPILAGLEAGLSVSSSPTIKTPRAEFMKSANPLSKATSKFLLVPTDPNLQGTSLSLKSVIGQVGSYPLSVNSPTQRTIPPVKAKSLEMAASGYSSNMSVGRTIEGEKNESETPDISSWKQFPVSQQDIQMVFQLPSSATVDMPQPATARLDGNLSPILTITKDVAERRQEFARTHLVLENGGKGQASSQMTPVKSVGAHLDDILRMNSALPVQYLVIAANADQSPAFVPVVAPAFPTFHPQVTAAFEAALQNQPVSTGVSETQMSFSGNREKTLNQQNVDRSCAPALSSSSTFRSIPSICITPADANPSAEASESLWKIKLKGRLLMKRSLNIEKALSEERENMPKRIPPDAGKLASLPSNEAFQPLNSDADVLQESGFLRSRSCDAAMPLKKRRKTLTELGRGTAFGTRVEDANEAANQSAELKSRQSARYRVELLKGAPSSVGFDEDAFLDQPENKEETPEQLGSCGTGSVCSSIPNLLSASATGRAFVPHFTPSVMSFSTAADKRPDVIGIPPALTGNIPGFVSERCSIRSPLQSAPGTPVSRQVLMTEKPETLKHPLNTDEPSRNVECDPMLGRSKTDSQPERSGETGVVATSDCSGIIDDAAIQGGTGPVMLLFSHLYPSLNVTTTPTFCSVVKPQPTYISHDANKKLSMYSNWQAASPIGDSSKMPGLSVSDMLALCQRNRTVLPHQYATSNISEPKSGVLTHSSYWNFKKELEMKSTGQEAAGKSSDAQVDSVEESASQSTDKDNGVKFSGEKSRSHDATINSSVAAKAVSCGAQESRTHDGPSARKEAKRIQICPGGYKSNEEYVYVRGRGKGKFVCELCGIRCKKPCMLMKHIRTHSDIRPHHCDVCSFGFKTKGNLSKHLKSKAHHLKCGDHESSHSHAVSTNSGDQPVDSNQSLDLNVSSSSCDLHEEEMDDDDDDDIRGCKDDNDEDKDDTDDDDDDDDDADDVESFDADESKGSTRVCLAEHLSASEANKVSENADDQCYDLSDKGDRLRAVTDSEAAASLLDLSKGNQALEMTGMSSSCDGPSVVSLPLSSLDPSLPYPVKLVNSNISQEGRDVAGRTDAGNALKTADFSPPVLLLTNYTNSSFQLPSPICFAVSNASMLSSIPNSRNQPWIILNPATLVQKPADFSGQPLIQDVERQDLDPGGSTSTPVVPGSECPMVSSVPPSSSSASPVVSPTVPVTETVAAHGNPRTHCEIIPVPGKVSGNADECVNGKYVCGICRKSYHESHQLTMHKNVHYLERPFPCSSCGVSFQNRTLLERHQRSERHACRSDDPRPFKCDPCGVAFRIHGHLAKHLRSKMHTAKCESAERGNSADDCYEERDGEDGEANVPFSRSESTEGTTASDGANETCPMDATFEADVAESSSNESAIVARCNDTFVSTSTQFMNSSGLPLPTEVTIMTPSGQKISLSQLQRQKQSIKDAVLTAPVHCDMCTKTFTDVSLFEKHINTHIELRPYICDICDGGFTSVRLLESHMETHNKTKDHVCGVCGDSLLSKSSTQMETPVHCVAQSYKRVLTASPATGNQCSPSASDTFVACPLQILHENATAAGGRHLPARSAAAAADDRNCAPVPESAAVPGGSQLRVIPVPNVFSLSDSRLLLMKHFGVGNSVGNSVVAPFDLDSVAKAASGRLIRVIEAAAQDPPVRPSNVLVATSSSPPGADAVACRGASDDVTGPCDVRQEQRLAVQGVKGVEPVCRLLTVSFHVGENVASKSPISSGGARENVFVVPNP